MYPKLKAPLLVASAVWLSAAIWSSIHYVPLWRNAVTLMSQCARTEGSSKCIIQTLIRAIHADGCGPVKDILEAGHKKFKDTSLKYDSEFQRDMPFYHAVCIALNVNMPPVQKLEQLPTLFDEYAGSAEIMFPIVLSHLQAKDLNGAWTGASSYYLSGKDAPIVATRNTINIYRGHAKALCEILQSTDCEKARYNFERVVSATPLDKGYQTWGYNVTYTMYKK